MQPAPLIIIPAFNEEKNIGAVIRAARLAVPSAEIVVVDDGSTDATGKLAQAQGARVLRLPFNLGYGSALQTGFRYALKRPFSFLATVDGDGQHDPSYIGRLAEELNSHGLDVVIGSRFLEHPGYKAPFLKRIGMRFFSFIASALIGQRITDATSGFQVMGRRAVEFCASEAYPVDFPDADVILMFHRCRLRIGEVPVKMGPPESPSMHRGLKPLYYVFKMLLSILVTLLRKKPEFGP